MTKNTVKFFETLNLKEDILTKMTVACGPLINRNCQLKRAVSKILVTSDTAEVEVALIHEYNGGLTKSEEQTRFILQFIVEHFGTLPSITKIASF